MSSQARSKNRPYVTLLSLALMLVLYLLMEFNGGSQRPEVLIAFGAKFNPLIANGEYWRLVTPIFLHIGFLHLLMNGLALYYLGRDLESVYGSFKFLIIFLLSGVMGNIFSFAFNNAISAGASTSIFGLFATTLVLAQANPYNPYLQAIAKSYKPLILINIIFNLFSQSVDIAGHLGGLLGGYLFSALVTYPKGSQRVGYGLFALIIALLVFALGIYRMGQIASF